MLACIETPDGENPVLTKLGHLQLDAQGAPRRLHGPVCSQPVHLHDATGLQHLHTRTVAVSSAIGSSNDSSEASADAAAASLLQAYAAGAAVHRCPPAADSGSGVGQPGSRPSAEPADRPPPPHSMARCVVGLSFHHGLMYVLDMYLGTGDAVEGALSAHGIWMPPRSDAVDTSGVTQLVHLPCSRLTSLGHARIALDFSLVLQMICCAIRNHKSWV